MSNFVVQPKEEGEKKDCPNCGKPLIGRLAVYKNPEWNKVIWQELNENKSHYDNKGNCKNAESAPETARQETVQESPEKPEPKTITPNGPFDEAELITRWASERAYKITMEEVTDITKLTVQEKSALGQKQGMLTRLLTDTVLDLMKQHNIKTDYGK